MPALTGSQLYKFTQNLYNTSQVTPDELIYAIRMLDPIAYTEAYHTVKGHNVTFDVSNYQYSKSGGHRPWQKQILRDMCNPKIPNVCVMKSRQLGISEVGVETMLYLMDRLSNGNPKFLYIFPTQRQMDGFLKTRIKNEVENSYYQGLTDKSNDSMEQLGIRNSNAFFRTGGSSGGLEGVDIDCILMDEYERYAGSSAEISGLESLKSSNLVNNEQHGLIRRWSTPSNPEAGIDQKFRESDQHIWMIKCPHCGKWQMLTFKDNLFVVDKKDIDPVSHRANPGACKYLCKYCHNDLESARWYNGRWFCKYPHQDKPHGYFISQLDAVWLSPDTIYTDYMRQDKADFYRYTLGAPYQDTHLTFVPADVTKHIRVPKPVEYRNDGPIRYRYYTLGIDWGQHFHHIVVMGMRSNGYWDVIGLYQIPTSTGTKHIDEDLRSVVSIIRRYKPDIVCADNGYSGDYVLRLQQLFPNILYKVMTRSAVSNGDPATNFNDNTMSLTIDKVTQAKIAIGDIKSGKIGFYSPTKDPLMPIFMNHWENVIIRRERKETTGQVVETMPLDKHDRPDHFASACTYAIIAMREVTNRLANNAGGIQVGSLDIADDNREVETGVKQNLEKDIGNHHRTNGSHDTFTPL